MVRNGEKTMSKTDHSGKETSWRKCSRLGVWELEGIKSGNSVQISAEALGNLHSLKKKQKAEIEKKLSQFYLSFQLFSLTLSFT